MDMMGFFTRRSSRPARRRLLTLEPLEDRTLLAGNLLITTEVPGSNAYNLMEYTRQGAFVSSQPIPQAPGANEYEDARGLSVSPNGNVNIFDGTFSPSLATYSPSANSWSFQTMSGWSLVAVVSSGKIAAYKNFVFAPDETTAGDGAPHGLIRFDTSGGAPVRFYQGYDFSQVTLGTDGLLYAPGGAYTGSGKMPVQVFDPDTLTHIGTITLQGGPDTDIRSIAVDSSGQIFAATWGGYLAKYDSKGNYTGESVQVGDSLLDLTLDTDGQIAAGGRNGEIYLTNESLTNVQTIQTRQWNVFVTFNHYIGVAPATASFVKTDTSTEGNWQGAYGSQGYNVIDNATSYPNYAQVSTTGNSSWVWNSSTTDPRALQEVNSNNRIAACWYAGTASGQGFTVNVNITDGQTHQLALYLLDWDQYGGGRSEQVQIVNASTGQVLDTENVSNFGNGEYLVWNIRGDIQIQITSEDSFGSAVVSGLFFDPPGLPPAPPAAGNAAFVKTDTTTEGNWQGVYGSQGYNVIDDATSYPSYAQVNASGNSSYVWNSSTTDPRALQEVGSNNGIAACWYAGTSSGQGFTINVNLTDGQNHLLALYLLDWDQYGGGRSEQVQILNAATGTVLDTQSVSNFGSGKYLVWNVYGDIQIRITSEDSFGSAVVSGLFFDAVGSPPPPPVAGKASFVKTDTTTEGNWQNVYGSQGYNVIDNATSYPSYAQVSATGNSNFVWNSSTTDPRALQEVNSNNRMAACWYAGTSSGQGFTINANLTDGLTHQLALYLLDWDQYGGGRSEQVQILDATTGTVLNTQNVSSFGNGEYLVWNVSGDIQIRITSEDSFGSAVVSGLFFDA
jgi:hypothetical protein